MRREGAGSGRRRTVPLDWLPGSRLGSRCAPRQRIFGFAAAALAGALTMLLALAVLSPARSRAGGPFPRFDWGPAFQATLLFGAALDDGFAPLHNPAAVVACGERQIALQQRTPFGVPVTAAAWCGGAKSGIPSSSSRSPSLRKSFLSTTTTAAGGHLLLRQTPAGLGFDYNTYVLAWTGGIALPIGSGPATGTAHPAGLGEVAGFGGVSREVAGSGEVVGSGGVAGSKAEAVAENAGLESGDTAGAAGLRGAGEMAGAVTVRLGVTPKLLFVSIKGTEGGYDDDGFGYGLDAGVGLDMPPRASGSAFSISLSALDVLGRMQYARGAEEPSAEPTYVFSAVDSGPRYTVGVAARIDSDSVRWSAGGEYVLGFRSERGGAGLGHDGSGDGDRGVGSPGDGRREFGSQGDGRRELGGLEDTGNRLRIVLRAGFDFGGVATDTGTGGSSGSSFRADSDGPPSPAGNVVFGLGIALRNFAVDYAFTRERGAFGDDGMHAIATRIFF